MRASRVAFLASALGVIAVACSLDWSARPDDVDAGPDATKDVTGESSSGSSGTPPPPPSPGDGSNVDCPTLERDLAAKRQAARACVQPGTADTCKTVLTDECHCKVVVAEGGAAANTAFQDAVQTFLSSPCDAGCASTCPAPNADTIAQSAWACGPTGCFP